MADERSAFDEMPSAAGALWNAVKSALSGPSAGEQIMTLQAAKNDLIRQKRYAEAAKLGLEEDPVAGAFAGSTIGKVGPGVVRAYHGSPHDFDRFDLSKIGTGEGAQAYGHGLYFAGNEGVARSYRDALQHKAPVQIDGDAGNATYILRNAIQEARKAAPDEVGRMAALRSELDDVIAMYQTSKYAPVGGLETAIQAKKLLESGAVKPSLAQAGRMYEVQINAPESAFLDWDAPLNNQSKQVQQAIMNLPTAHKINPDRIASGGEFYESRHLVPGEYRDKVQAANVLSDLGIPGIKYLDQGSRAAGEGSRNYVVFDDKLIDILRKYGLAGLTTAGAAAAASDLYPDQGSGMADGGALPEDGASNPVWSALKGAFDSLSQATGAMGREYVDAISAGAQGTSPFVKGLDGTFNYMEAPDREQSFFAEVGQPSDGQKYVALRDPETGRMRVYYRSGDMNESGLGAIGKMLGLGTVVGPVKATREGLRAAARRAASAKDGGTMNYADGGSFDDISRLSVAPGTTVDIDPVTGLPRLGSLSPLLNPSSPATPSGYTPGSQLSKWFPGGTTVDAWRPAVTDALSRPIAVDPTVLVPSTAQEILGDINGGGRGGLGMGDTGTGNSQVESPSWGDFAKSALMGMSAITGVPGMIGMGFNIAQNQNKSVFDRAKDALGIGAINDASLNSAMGRDASRSGVSGIGPSTQDVNSALAAYAAAMDSNMAPADAPTNDFGVSFGTSPNAPAGPSPEVSALDGGGYAGSGYEGGDIGGGTGVAGAEGNYAGGGMIPSGSYVIPADVVGAFGNGSTMAGARHLGMSLGGRLVDGPGDGRSDDIPFRGPGGRQINLSNGEVVIPPAGVDAAGGADRLDSVVMQKRKKQRRAMGAFGRPAR